jgi:hypothetical protein
VSQSSDKSRRVLLPPDITPDHVLGLLEMLYSLGDNVDSMYIGDSLGESVETLPHAIDVAETLGLVRASGGNLQLTELGKKVVRGDPKTVRRELRRHVEKLEPLGELIRKLRERKSMSVEEFMEIIEKHYPGNSEEAAKNVLIWGAFLNLFKMDEDDEEVHLIH